jgi:hypothetical protein
MANVTHALGRMLGTIPTPNSAYENLITQMTVAEGGCLWTPEEATALVNAVLHEAAETIRTEEAPNGHDNTFDAGAIWASELIRPTATDPQPDNS